MKPDTKTAKSSATRTSQAADTGTKRAKGAAGTSDEGTTEELKLAEVKTLTKMGKKKGNLTEEEIQSAIGDLDLSDEQVDSIYAAFKKSGIAILDEPDEAVAIR